MNPFLRTDAVRLKEALISAGYLLPEGSAIIDNAQHARDDSFAARIIVYNALRKAKECFDEEMRRKHSEKNTRYI